MIKAGADSSATQPTLTGPMAKKKLAVDELWEIAKAGTRKLTATERRRVLVYLDEIGEKRVNNYQLAKWFQVSETVIRQDKKRMVERYVSTLAPDQAMQFVAAHYKDLEDLIGVTKNGLDQTESGTMGERFYVETLSKLYKERLSLLQEIGVVRKELGNLNVSEEKWVATVDTNTGECGVYKDEGNNDES